MKILNPGKSIKIWVGKCVSCEAIITAKRNELTIQKGDRLTDNEDFAWADCPVCNKCKSVCFHEDGTKSTKNIERDMSR